jgi:hypothetical protein
MRGKPRTRSQVLGGLQAADKDGLDRGGNRFEGAGPDPVRALLSASGADERERVPRKAGRALEQRVEQFPAPVKCQTNLLAQKLRERVESRQFRFIPLEAKASVRAEGDALTGGLEGPGTHAHGQSDVGSHPLHPAGRKEKLYNPDRSHTMGATAKFCVRCRVGISPEELVANGVGPLHHARVAIS